MKTLIAFFFAGFSVLAQADEPEPINIMCVAKPEATAEQLYQSCAESVVQQICPGGFELVNVIKNVTRPPFFLAATITCKGATPKVKGLQL